MSVPHAQTGASRLPTLAYRLTRILPFLTALPPSHLPLLGEWARQASHEQEVQGRLDALRRAQRRAEADIRTALERLAGEFDVLAYEVDDVMARVSDSIEDLTWSLERELIRELDGPDQSEALT